MTSSFLFTIRHTLYLILLIIVSFWAIGIGLVATLFGQRLNTNYYVARTFWHVAGPLIGWSFEVQGEEHLWRLEGMTGDGRSAVLVGNHQSSIDILYLGRIFPRHAAIMAKKELQLVPGLGWFMMLSGTVFINRRNNRSAVASMTQAGEEMKRKRISLWIFPEGTRHMSDDPDLLPFKKGAFHLAVQSGVPVIPIVCQNYSHLFKRDTYFNRGSLKIRVLPPIPTTGLSTEDVPALMEKTRSLMLDTLRELSLPETPPSTSSSPAPLLGDNPRISASGYYTLPDRDEAEVEAAVGGGSSNPSLDHEEAEYPTKIPKGLVIAMVSDFFLPVAGGVEGHIYSLSVELARRGHQVVVISHHHRKRVGVRYLAPGIKIYHLPYVPIASSASLPNFFLFLPYLRSIIIREKIDILHGHGSLSSLAHEAMLHAPLFHVRTVFTDHSLFGFADTVGVLTNKLLAGALRNTDGVICVSNTGRENTVLRAEINPERVSVIPNAVVPSQFKPGPRRTSVSHITIVIISRLVYRKGIDLLVASAPKICELFPDVRFIVGGDGPKMVDLLQMREKYQLQDRFELLGSIRPADVRSVLIRGDIYLNTSLTEAFGISIIEAASTGLFVVATRVGGVPEILPADMIEFARAEEDDVIRALSHAIYTIRERRHNPLDSHNRVKDMYSWSAVADRTEAVYSRTLASPQLDTFARLTRLWRLGPVFGPIMCTIIAVQHWFLFFLNWYDPPDEIDVVPKAWDATTFAQLVKSEATKRTPSKQF